ncbi:hypothetical protein [Clostridium sp. ZS2]|uniref:hypothetical protein n=1 Tax=Clostridium sp. ZS2 TaxID=2949988 RepID=UPI002079E942|nr:hypothetical protein [Clostridium sp. ZS2]
MSKYLWIAISQDKYELPLAVEESALKLAKKLKVSHSCITASEYRYRKTNTGKYNSKCDIRIVKVLNVQ